MRSDPRRIIVQPDSYGEPFPALINTCDMLNLIPGPEGNKLRHKFCSMADELTQILKHLRQIDKIGVRRQLAQLYLNDLFERRDMNFNDIKLESHVKGVLQTFVKRAFDPKPDVIEREYQPGSKFHPIEFRAKEHVIKPDLIDAYAADLNLYE